jgi:hypothetical protein
MDIVWLIWECFYHYIANKNLLQSFLDIFLFRYTKKSAKKNIFLLYSVACIYTEQFETNELISNNIDLINNVKENIFRIYKTIKKHERFSEKIILSSNSYEKTLSKLTKLNQFSEKFVPRMENANS